MVLSPICKTRYRHTFAGSVPDSRSEEVSEHGERWLLVAASLVQSLALNLLKGHIAGYYTDPGGPWMGYTNV